MQKESKFSGYWKKIVAVAVIGAVAAALLRTRDTIALCTFFLATYTSWDYYSSPLYMDYLRSEWRKLPIVEPTPVLEFTMANFSQKELMRLTNNLAEPVVIRGAVADANALNKWNREYFLEHYSNLSLVVREMFLDEVTERPSIRLESRTFSEFYTMKDKGRNVSVIASSAAFQHDKNFETDVLSPIEDEMMIPNNGPLAVMQFFITPGGRSWYHSEIGNNVFRQIAGQKRWNVISPEYNFYMCPKPVISGTSDNPDCLLKMNNEEREEWIKRIPRQTVLLQPGDVFINGPWWWHDVISEYTEDDSQISVAGRAKNFVGMFIKSAMFSVVALISKVAAIVKDGKNEGVNPISLQKNIVESWYRNCISMGRTDCRTPV